MFSVWLEAFALGPQVMLLVVSHFVDSGSMHFVVLSCASSFAFGWFWCKSAYDQYAEFQKDGTHVFYWGILSCVTIRVSLCLAFLYFFIKKNNGKGYSSVPSGVDDVFADDMI